MPTGRRMSNDDNLSVCSASKTMSMTEFFRGTPLRTFAPRLQRVRKKSTGPQVRFPSPWSRFAFACSTLGLLVDCLWEIVEEEWWKDNGDLGGGVSSYMVSGRKSVR
jgi:hypothetical protein